MSNTPLRPVLRASRAGFVVAGGFLLAASAVFAWIFLGASTNPADSGESGLLLVPFASPWIRLIPASWLGMGAGVGSILLNALLLYCIFGGVRWRRSG